MSRKITDGEVDLSGQVALVTGGGRGLGRAFAWTLAAAGAAVAVTARSQAELAETVKLVEDAGGQAIAFPADVTDHRAVEEMVAVVEEQLGPVDLLVNNAAVGTLSGPVWETDIDAWWGCLDVNLRGPFLCARAVLPGMVDRGRGRVINVASGAGLRAIPYFSAYVISKTALIRFTENLAVEAREHGICAFSVDPGTVRTAMSERLLVSDEGKKWLSWFQKIFDEGRDVPPDQAAHLVRFLASGKADALSGRLIQVSDDVTEMLRRAEEIQHNNLHTLRLRR